MQPSGPQFTSAGAPFGLEPQVYPQQSPYGGPAQTYPQSLPYAQPQAQPYAQPYAQPAYGQPQAPYMQPPPQPYMPPQTQAAPVSPVASPAYPSTGGQQQPGGAQSIQQAYAQRMITIAKSLEQMIPGFQVSISVLEDLAGTPGAQSLTGFENLLETIKNSFYYQLGALGSIRRFLCGETTSAVLGSLAVSVNQVGKLHAEQRPLLEQLINSTAPDMRSVVSGLLQTWATADTALNQAGAATQATVGPQIWDLAKTKVFAKATSSES